MAGGAGVAEDSTEGNKDAGLAQGPAQLSILNLILLHTMGARRQRQGGGRSYLPVSVGWERWHHHTDRWPWLGKSVGENRPQEWPSLHGPGEMEIAHILLGLRLLFPTLLPLSHPLVLLRVLRSLSYKQPGEGGRWWARTHPLHLHAADTGRAHIHAVQEHLPKVPAPGAAHTTPLAHRSSPSDPRFHQVRRSSSISICRANSETWVVCLDQVAAGGSAPTGGH